jgi:putative transposase
MLLETLFKYRSQGKYFLHEFVVMRDHIHLLLTPAGDTTLERAMQLIKGGFSFRASKELGLRGEIWQLP